MIRKVIEIDEDKCYGCGICVEICEEGAIGLIDGKAKLLRDDYCDGLGNCLPICPVEAITFVEREALAYDEKAVAKNISNHKKEEAACGCLGSSPMMLKKDNSLKNKIVFRARKSELNQWPVQIKLVSAKASYFNDANLLIAADCAAYANGDFHNEFMQDRITIIGCPKLDDGDYSRKLTDIIAQNNIKSITVVRMEVPCCLGIANAAFNALENSGKTLPFNSVVLSVNGEVV